MKKIIKLYESDLLKIINKVLSEQGLGRPIPSNFGQDIVSRVRDNITAIQTKLKSLGYNLGTSGPNRDGIDGVYGKMTRNAIVDFQRKNSLTPDGIVGTNTAKKLGVSPLSSDQIRMLQKGQTIKTSGVGQKTQTTQKKQLKNKLLGGSGSKFATLKGVSDQVKRQLDYMLKNNLLSDEKFTILDDNNNRVHAFEPGYSLFKTFYVITGEDRGEEFNPDSLVGWALSPNNWGKISQAFRNTNKESARDQIKSCYLGSWKMKSTPSGVFRRAGVTQSFFNDQFLTYYFEDTYGKKYITWETCDGSTIPLGFHGTKSTERLKVLNAKDIAKQSCSKRNISFGCINFKDEDIKTINNFINAGQLTIWLPDTSNDIVQIPTNCITTSIVGTIWNKI
jgi:hypothetical protein